MPEGTIRFIVGFFALLIGWAVGFFDSKIRADKKIKEAEDSAHQAILQAKAEAARTVQGARIAAEASRPVVPPGTSILRLWLDSTERPMLDLDGQRVDTAPISEVHRKRLITLLNVMRPWIEGKTVASVVPPPVAPPSIPAPTSSPVSAPQPVPASMPARPVTVKKDDKAGPPSSIVGQIDEILQTQLESTILAGRGIRLQESPEGGVIVWVGLQKFNGVDEVTDLEVKAVIRAAIAEWERKYSP